MLQTVLTLFLAGLNLQSVGVEPVSPGAYCSSGSGNYFYQIEYGTEGIGETPIKSFTLYDSERHLLVRKDRPGEEAFLVSDAGWFAGIRGIPGGRALTFYDRSGNVVTRREIAGDVNCAFSQTGIYLYVNAREGLSAFNADGGIAARFGTGSGFRAAMNDRYVATVQNDLVRVWRFGEGDHKEFRLGSLLFRDLAFSPGELAHHGRFLAVAERSSVSLYSCMPEPVLVWQRNLGRGVSLLRVAVDDQGRVYAGGETRTATRAGFLAAFENGEEVARTEIPYASEYETITGVRCDGAQCRVRTTDHEFRFQEAE
jgi:hypothetical protein